MFYALLSIHDALFLTVLVLLLPLCFLIHFFLSILHDYELRFLFPDLSRCTEKSQYRYDDEDKMKISCLRVSFHLFRSVLELALGWLSIAR